MNTMKIETNKGKFLFVEVPDDAYDVQSWNHGIGFKHDNYEGETDTNGYYHIHTGLGRWSDYISVATTKDITEEQAESIVEFSKKEDTGYYCNWYKNYNQSTYTKSTAKESLQSLIQSLGLNIEKNYIILKHIS